MDNTKQNLILGALVADAATCGLHWIYDQQRILVVADKTPEFHPPTQSDYDGVPSFFSHGKRSVGDCSHYGEQAFVLLNALASNNGKYDRAQYQDAFKAHFSYGGDYVGYIDRPTKDTLDNIILIGFEIIYDRQKVSPDAQWALLYDKENSHFHFYVTILSCMYCSL